MKPINRRLICTGQPLKAVFSSNMIEKVLTTGKSTMKVLNDFDLSGLEFLKRCLWIVSRERYQRRFTLAE